MAKKIFRTQEYTLHIITSVSGVMILKLIDRLTKEMFEQKVFTDVGDDFTDYIESIGFDTQQILTYLSK